MNMSPHRSTFELDVYQASTPAERESPANADLVAHLASCPDCRGYLESLDALALSGPSLVAANAIARSSRPPAMRRSLFRMRGTIASASVAGALALAASIFFVVRAKPMVDDESSYVGVKGVPAAQALIRREGRVHVWDGVSPVRAGDAIALNVACERFAHVTVSAGGDGGAAGLRSWEGDCPAPGVAASTLPFTFVVDSAPGPEHFTVVLSRSRLADDRLKTALRASTRSDEAWTIDFSFAKEER